MQDFLENETFLVCEVQKENTKVKERDRDQGDIQRKCRGRRERESYNYDEGAVLHVYTVCIDVALN